MTKADIVSEIAKTTGIDKASVVETSEKFMETVKERLPATSLRTLPSSFQSTRFQLSSQLRCSWSRLRSNPCN